MALTKCYVGLPVATLQSLQTQLLNLLQQGNLAIGQQYTIGERHYTLESMSQINESLAEVAFALRLASGQTRSRIFPNFSNRRCWRF